jgi:hypothetical protein
MDRYLKKAQKSVPTHQNSVNEGSGFSRREFFKLTGLGLTGFFFSQVARPLEVLAQSGPSLVNKARYCIFIHLDGAPSHVDTFDLKEGSWTPSDFQPTSFGDIRWPKGLLPRLADQLQNIAIVRSMSAWALVHPLAQVWTQIGRNPASGLSAIAPNIGAVVALEYEKNRANEQKLPGFIALNAGGGIRNQGYLSPQFAPFNTTANPTGLDNTLHPEGEDRFLSRYSDLEILDNEFRKDSPLGITPNAMASSYEQARGLMYNPAVSAVFRFTAEESSKFGNNAFGNACLVARNIIKSDLGTHFIQINSGGWDHHSDIYNRTQGIYPRASQLDSGLAQLISDLAATPSKSGLGKTLLDETLIVAMGEFGRTVGQLTNQRGRDHYLQMSALFAGAGIRGNQAIGKTDATGGSTVDFGWSRNVLIRPEDVFCTIYSTLGIDFTTVRSDDPFRRGFEYVPYAKDGIYAPIDTLW